MKTINIGIMAHIDAGKTTLTENLLYKSGAIRKLGKIEAGNTTTDTLEMERRRGITIKETTTSLDWNGAKINILDTPGHFDFFSEVLRTLYVMDLAVLVISGVEGIQTQTDRIIRILQEKDLPFIVFINKLDRIGYNPSKVIEELRSKCKTDLIQMQKADTRSAGLISGFEDEELLEENLLTMSMHSPECLNYLDRKEPSRKDITSQIIRLFWEKKAYPIFLGSAKKDIGIAELLDYIAEIAKYDRIGTTSDDKVSGVIYKISHDNGKQLCFFRLYHGSVSKLQDVKIGENIFRIKNLYTIENTKTVSCETVKENDIGILTNLHDLKVGDIIGEDDEQIREIVLTEPFYRFAVYPADLQQKLMLTDALEEIAVEDPSISFQINEDHSILNVSGVIQKEYIVDRLVSEYGIDCRIGEMDIIVKETVKKTGIDYYDFGESKSRLNAAMMLEISPLERGRGIEYCTEVSFGYLNKSFQNAAREGVFIGVKNGLQGGELTDIKVTFKAARYDSVTSSPADFRRLAPELMQKIIRSTGTILLYPFMDVVIRVKTSVSRAVVQHLSLLGQLNGIEVMGDDSEITYIIEPNFWNDCLLQLNSVTSGRYEYRIRRAFYDERPNEK